VVLNSFRQLEKQSIALYFPLSDAMLPFPTAEMFILQQSWWIKGGSVPHHCTKKVAAIPGLQKGLYCM